MPRTYTKKKVKKYTPQDLSQAIEKVKDGEMTAYSAAQRYNIPMTTLHEHLKVNIIRPNAGRPLVIPLEIEKKLAETIIIMEKWGFGLSRLEIMEIVSEYLRLNNIQTPFKNNIPGPDWFINFRKRHGLSIKKAQPVEYVRRKMTDPFVIGEYFGLLKKTLSDLNIIGRPQFIWNLDETSLCLDPSKTKVVGQKNKPSARTTHGSGKENITVLAGASASGKKLPPLIIFKGAFVWDQWMADLEDGYYDFELSYAASKKGWMETDIFYNYFEKILIPSIGEERPVLIIYDGHSTHVDARVVELAIRNHITILKLPPHTSHLLQPLDISVFKSFKMKWDAKLVDWQRRNVGTKMPKKVFAQAMAETWQQLNPDVIKSGFKKAGIYPFNEHVIPAEKYDPDTYQRYLKHMSKPNCTHTHDDLKNPKSLIGICIDLINDQFTSTNETFEMSNTDNVSLLSQQSKSNIQMMSFVANHPSQIPSCLQNSKPSQVQAQPKIRILSNVILKEASQPLLPAQVHIQPLLHAQTHPKRLIQAQVHPQQLHQAQAHPKQLCSFEELLLRKIQQDKKDNTATKKKRITKGAEVITTAMGKKILSEMGKSHEVKKVTTSIRKNMKNKGVNKKKESTVTTQYTEIKQSQPSCSGIKRKRKRLSSVDSITSVSDIMSEHTDSDIFDCDDIQDSEGTQILAGEEIPSEKKTTFLSVKGKGIGKRSKGKENQEVNSIKRRNLENKEDTKEIDFSEEQLTELETKDAASRNQENDLSIHENYKLNDSVLVRYLIRNKWKYFIGFIKEITKYENKNYYLINFLKTTRVQKRLTFITIKKKDIDKVPEDLVIKKIDIKKDSDKAKNYYLTNEEDTVYFT